MITDFTELWKILAGTTVIFIFLILIFRKHVIHAFDPLLYYVITQAFTIEMGFITITDNILLGDFLLCQCLFMIGFFLCAGKSLTRSERNTGIFFKPVVTLDVSVLKWYVFFATLMLTVGNLVLIQQKGIALFSDDPSVSKVADFTEGTGLGIVRRMNSGLLYFVAVLNIFLFIYKKQLRYIFMALLLIMFAAFSGSKSSLIFFVLLSSFFFCFKDLKNHPAVKKLKIANYFIIIISFLLLAVIFAGAGASSINDILLRLGTRFLFYGDAIIYYYNWDAIHHFSSNNVVTFLQDELNYMLGFFRLVPYTTSVNVQLINYYFNMADNDFFGPNVPYYVKGNLYFGFTGGLIYSFSIGCGVGLIRRLFYNVVRNRSSSVIFSMTIVYLNIIVYSLPQDSLLFFNKLFDITVLSLPLFVIIYLLHLPEIQLKPAASAIVNT